MAHYDSCYESDAAKAYKEFNEFCADGYIRVLDLPQRIQDALPQIHDWLFIEQQVKK